MFETVAFSEKQKETLIPNFTCPVCGCFNKELLDKMSKDFSTQYSLVKEHGQYFCSINHRDKHYGKKNSEKDTESIFVWRYN